MRKIIAIMAVMAMVLGITALAGAVQPDFVEDFEDGNVDGWVTSHPTLNGKIEAVTTPVSPSGGNYVGKVTFDGSCYGPHYLFDPVTPDYISWNFRADGDTGNPSGLAFAIRSSIGGGGWMAFISYHQGAMRLALAGWDYLEIMPASMGTWYLIEVKNIDWDSDTFDIWVDGVEKVVDQPFIQPVDDVSFFFNYACGASGPSYVDDITFAVNEPPVSDPGGPYLVAVENNMTLDGSGSSDPDGDALTESWTADGGTVVGTTYTAGAVPGIYDVCLTVNDGTFDSEESCIIVVVYDPAGGFVTGGGWIDSPAGAYVDDGELTGRANFGFVSKYKKGASIPTGNTEFQFHAADLNFHSESYQWLVVTGSDYAMFKGVGTINGEGEHNFRLWAGDDEPDTFRIKIWTEDEFGDETVVYDNGMDQAIGGGSIAIHTKEK